MLQFQQIALGNVKYVLLLQSFSECLFHSTKVTIIVKHLPNLIYKHMWEGKSVHRGINFAPIFVCKPNTQKTESGQERSNKMNQY